MTAPTDERAALPPADFRWVQVGAYNVRGGRVVEWEILNAADERPDGIYALFAAKAPDHHGMQSKAARAALSAQQVGAVQPPTSRRFGDVAGTFADPAGRFHPTESAGEAVQRPAIEGLLPCPFCGGPVDKFDDDLSDDGVVLECRWCDASRSSTRESAVEGWNRRTPAASVNSASDRSDDFDHAHPDSWKYEAKSEVGGAVQPPPSSPEPLTDERIDELFRTMCQVDPTTDSRVWYVDGATLNKSDVRDFVRALAAPPSSTPEPLTDERAADVAELQAQIERLTIRGAAYENAYRIAYQATYQSHTGHWDKTGRSGAGCPECIRAREARENCDAELRDGLAALIARV